MTTLTRTAAIALAAVTILAGTAPAAAQSVPDIDTEDSTLGSARVAREGGFHPMATLDVRNGDYARGDFDVDRAALNRVPTHVQAGFAWTLAEGSWLVVRSSNGLHAPNGDERTSPRAWYESNNLAALVVTPLAGLRTAAVYTIKTSPNGVSATTHEASLSAAYAGDDAVGDLSPTAVATWRPKGGGGVYTQIGLGPSIPLGEGDAASSVDFPLAVGVGWGGFYAAGSGNRLFAQAGVAYERPFAIGTTRWSARAEGLALIRDRRLAALSGPKGETGRIVPLVTLAVSMAY